MSILKNVQTGKIVQPDLICVYGVDGVGKTTFAADAPNPLFVGPEHGSANLDVARVPGVDSLQKVVQVVDELLSAKHDYKTLVLDSLDWLEPMVWHQVCQESGASHIGDACGGYGKGYVKANQYWKDLMDRIGKLRDQKGMSFVAIAHSEVKPFNDPQNNATYDRYQLKLNDKASALWREFSDAVLFVNFEVYTKTDDKKKTRALGEGVRVMHTERRPGFDAKNRFGLPHQLPLSWQAYQDARHENKTQKADEIRVDVLELLKQVSDKELAAKVSDTVEKAGNSSEKLVAIRNRLRTLLNT